MMQVCKKLSLTRVKEKKMFISTLTFTFYQIPNFTLFTHQIQIIKKVRKKANSINRVERQILTER